MEPNILFFWIAVVALGLHFIYILILFPRFTYTGKQVVKPVNNKPLSVIVCGRNEAENFKRHLPLLLKQDYADFEVVAVNDQSVDDSNDVLEELQKEYPTLRIVTVPENDQFWHGKKYALTLGIKAAKNEYLVFTDADCVPSSPNWLSYMSGGFEQGKEIVLGYGPLKREKGFLNALIRFETMQTAIQYFSFALWGMPYMGVGRNMAYKKEVFFRHNGFIKHIHVASGDDDLFINEAANARNTAVVYHRDAQMISEGKKTWKDWKQQKRRHNSTSKYYKGIHKFILGTYGSLQLITLPLAIVAILLGYQWKVMLGLVLARVVFQVLNYALSSRFLGSGDVSWLLPVYEYVWSVQTLRIHWLNKFKGQPKRW